MHWPGHDKTLTSWFKKGDKVDVASTIADAVSISKRRIDAKLAASRIGIHLHYLHRNSVEILEASTASLGVDNEQKLDDAIAHAVQHGVLEERSGFGWIERLHCSTTFVTCHKTRWIETHQLR